MVISVCGYRAAFADNAHGLIGCRFAQLSVARPVSDDSATSGAPPREHRSQLLEKPMWSKPEYTEMRFGFEVTMYIANR